MLMLMFRTGSSSCSSSSIKLVAIVSVRTWPAWACFVFCTIQHHAVGRNLRIRALGPDSYERFSTLACPIKWYLPKRHSGALVAATAS